MFLITDKQNKSFGDFYWSVDSVNETENPNHYFRLYDNLDLAIYLSPFFGYKEFNVWSAEGSGTCIEERTSKKFSKAKSISLVENFTLPTKEKRITAAILCSLNVVKNPDFLNWCSSYLSEDDRSKEKAFVLRESISDTEDECEYFSSAIPILSCLLKEEDFEQLAAASIFRSISDSVDTDQHIDLNQIFKITSFVPPKDIAAIIN